MVDEYINEYIFSGSLPENASTYVRPEADDELYEALKQGKFCYVLNSRQSGKSSLRVRTMSRLSEAGVVCASIDLSSINIQSVTQKTWYADLIVKLIDSFDLDVDFQEWWEKNQLNSDLLRFGNFLEKKLLVEIRESIVIFIDEIDSVLSLQFPTDDFFAFIFNFSLVVTIHLAIILINCSHSSKRLSICDSDIISDLINSFSQYLVSFASFRAIDCLLIKSLSLSAERDSSIFAPIDVPDLNN